MRIGLSSGGALLLLVGSLIGSYFNLPVAHLPAQQMMTGREVEFFGMRYIVPVVVEWPGTMIAVNVGGAVIPTLMSLYLLNKNALWGRGLIATAIVTAVCYWLSRPIAGLGIAEPVFVPAVTAAIIGPRTMEQLESQLGAVDVQLDAAVLDRIDEIVPPGTNFGWADAGYSPPGIADARARRRN
jgi:uncharacterized membrane protein